MLMHRNRSLALENSQGLYTLGLGARIFWGFLCSWAFWGHVLAITGTAPLLEGEAFFLLTMIISNQPPSQICNIFHTIGFSQPNMNDSLTQKSPSWKTYPASTSQLRAMFDRANQSLKKDRSAIESILHIRRSFSAPSMQVRASLPCQQKEKIIPSNAWECLVWAFFVELPGACL